MSNYPARLLVRTTPPASEPLMLAEAKLYLRVDGAAEDTLIAEMIVAARLAAEEYTRKSFITQGWTVALDGGTPGAVMLARGPVQQIVAVTAISRDGATTVISPAYYALNAARDAAVLEAPLYAHRLEIAYLAGYGAAAADVPAALKQGMLTHIAALFDTRGADATIPALALALYQPYREVRL